MLAAHPHWRDSRVNRRLLAAARGVPGVDVNDLYGSYPDYAIDVEAEQRPPGARRPAGAAAPDPVVLDAARCRSSGSTTCSATAGPTAPAARALQGKDFWLVATTGGPEASYHPQSYNRYFFDAFLPPYEQTAALCGMRFLPPLILHGARSASAAEVDAHVDTFAQRLGSYPDWPEIDELDDCVACPCRGRPAAVDDRKAVAEPLCRGDRRPCDAPTASSEAGLSMEHAPAWLTSSLIYLGAAVLVVPLSKALGLGSIIGYLVAGIAIGPWGLGLVSSVEDVLHFAEFGVVLMLFLVGLELEPKRLWSLRRPIFGWGAGAGARLRRGAVRRRLRPRAPTGAWRWWRRSGWRCRPPPSRCRCSASATCCSTPSGQAGFSILLFQDVAAIPILALLPLLAGRPPRPSHRPRLDRALEALKIVGVIAGIVLGGRLLLRPLLRWIARSDTPEIFTAAALLLVVAIAALMQLGRPVDGARRLPRRRAAGRKRIPARARDRHRALQGPAAGPVLHRGGHERSTSACCWRSPG